jgi:hypothetical protein
LQRRQTDPQRLLDLAGLNGTARLAFEDDVFADL